MQIPHPFIPLTDTQHNVLTGLMLGDGHMAFGASNINAALSVGRSTKDEQYLLYEMSVFNNFLPPRHKNNDVYYSRAVDNRTGKARSDCMFSTVHSPTFTPYYSLWYQNVDSRKVKQVPNSLKLNGQVVAHWIADDGFVTYNKLPHRLQCDFATQGFSKSEVEFLASLLNDRYGEEFLIKPKRRNDKMYYIIRAYDSACRAMFLDIDPYFKMERKRIWDKPESRFWSNQPERQRSTIHDFANRKVLLAKIIDAGEPITMKELAKQLGYTDGGKPGYANVNKLLKPYTDAGRIVKEFDNMNYNAVTIRIVKGI